MIQIYHQKIGDTWYAGAFENERVLATAFSPNEGEVMQCLLGYLPYDKPFMVAEEPNPSSARLLKTLKKIFDGKEVSSKFEMAMDHLPQYSQKVLKCTSLIPIGYFTTYGGISKIVGGSPRAVGRALALNPFPLLIPCHRVVRADFTVGGCVFGEKTKLGLLRREDRGYTEPTAVKANDKALSLYPVRYVKEL